MNKIILFLIIFPIISIKSQKYLSFLRVSDTSAIVKCDVCALNPYKEYQLKVIKVSEPEQNVLSYEMNENVTNVEVDQLVPGSLYYVELVDLLPDEKLTVDHAKLITKPSPPINTKLIINETDFRVEWTASELKGGTYLIYLTDDTQSELDYYELENDEQNTSEMFSNLIPGKVYVLAIFNSVIVDNEVIVSDPVISRFRARPLPPTNARADPDALSSHSFVIEWDPPNGQFDGYSVCYQSKDNKQITKFIDKSKTRLNISESIDPGINYRIKIKTILENSIIQSNESRPIYLEITTRPLPVIELQSKTIGEKKVFLNWRNSPLSNQDSYKVTYWNKPHNKQYKVTNMTHAYLSNMKYGQNYTFSVAALSNNISSNDLNIKQKVEDKSLMLVPIIITLIISSIICVIISGTYLYKLKYKRKSSDDSEHDETLDSLHGSYNQNSNFYTALGPVVHIDEQIKINRDELELQVVIGQGQYGTVYMGLILMKNAQLSVKQPVAIKTSNYERDMNSFLEEALIMKNFNHNNVLSLIGVSLDLNGSPLVVLPLMKNRDLLKYVRNEQNLPTVRQLVSFVVDVANGMEYLSSLNFVHRDLAARNCMLDDDLTVKIADFGLSRHLKLNSSYISDNDSKQLLPLRWMSIESIEKGYYDTKTDVWSYGVLVWEVITRGVTPYPELCNREILSFLKSGKRLPKPLYCPNSIYDTLLSCWQIEPTKRPSFQEMSSKLKQIIDNSGQILQRKHIDINEANIYYNIDNSS